METKRDLTAEIIDTAIRMTVHRLVCVGAHDANKPRAARIHQAKGDK